MASPWVFMKFNGSSLQPKELKESLACCEVVKKKSAYQKRVVLFTILVKIILLWDLIPIKAAVLILWVTIVYPICTPKYDLELVSYLCIHVGVPISGDTLNSSILMGFSLINHPFWTTSFKRFKGTKPSHGKSPSPHPELRTLPGARRRSQRRRWSSDRWSPEGPHQALENHQ